MVTTHAMMRKCSGGGVAVSACLMHGGILRAQSRILWLGHYALGQSNHCSVEKLSNADISIHSLPARQSHDQQKNAAQLTQYKLTALEKDLLKHSKLSKPYRGRITMLSPHLKASSTIAIHKTLAKSPKKHGTLTLELQLKGLEGDIKKAIMELKHEHWVLEDSLPYELQCCNALTSNPQWMYYF
jgi:hypothetical protein